MEWCTPNAHSELPSLKKRNRILKLDGALNLSIVLPKMEHRGGSISVMSVGSKMKSASKLGKSVFSTNATAANIYGAAMDEEGASVNWPPSTML